MFSCQTCSISYAWSDSLKRHLRHAHSQDASSEEMDADCYVCFKCGAVFNSETAKRNHMETCDDDQVSDLNTSSVAARQGDVNLLDRPSVLVFNTSYCTCILQISCV